MKNKDKNTGLKGKLKKLTSIYSIYRWYVRLRIKFIREVRYTFVIFIRARRPISKCLKKKYPAKYYIHLEVTYNCDLKCNNCNRFCSQAPSDTCMTIEQIRKFIRESTDNGVKWRKIIISGGEPTLHPDILQIVGLLSAYKKEHSLDTIVQFQTNGYGRKTGQILSKIPSGIEIVNSSKKSSVQRFHPINLAPIDSILYRGIDFSLGCDYIPKCGISLTPYGYYPCSIAAAIDRVFGFDIGRKRMPSFNDPMLEMLPKLCRFCGAFRCAVHTKKQKTSPSWKAALEKYQEEKPLLTLY